MVASFEKGQEKQASQRMSHLWDIIKAENILSWWPYVGPVRGIIDKSGFFDNAPIQPFVTKEFAAVGGQIKRKFTIGIVDAQTGEYVIVDEKIGADKIPFYVKASASVPGIFPYLKDGDRVFIDGGTTDNINLKGGLAKCREIVGDDDEAITIDVVLTNPCKFLNSLFSPINIL
jgi:predicted acylesterase/phospholipase RssA